MAQSLTTSGGCPWQGSGPRDGGRALGAAIAALGLSNKAVYAEDGREAAAAERPGAEFYSEGPEIAPNSVPSAVSGAHATAADTTAMRSGEGSG